eukprot:1143013-Pelagomonas_calceolata.AAC.6
MAARLWGLFAFLHGCAVEGAAACQAASASLSKGVQHDAHATAKRDLMPQQRETSCHSKEPTHDAHHASVSLEQHDRQDARKLQPYCFCNTTAGDLGFRCSSPFYSLTLQSLVYAEVNRWR